MNNKTTRRDFLGLIGAALVGPTFAASVSAQESLSPLESSIKAQIALGYRLELSETPTTYMLHGTTVGCDPLQPVSETIGNSMLIGKSYNLKLTGTLAGLRDDIELTDKTATMSDLEMRRGSVLSYSDIYKMLDRALNKMAKKWAIEVQQNPKLMQALQNPRYTITQNCHLS